MVKFTPAALPHQIHQLTLLLKQSLSANCQKCKQPLKLLNNLDDSLAALSPSAYDIISASFSSQYQPNQHQSPSRIPPSLRTAYQTTTSPRSYATNSRPPIKVTSPYPIPSLTQLPSDSFVVLTESVVGPARTATANGNNSQDNSLTRAGGSPTPHANNSNPSGTSASNSNSASTAPAALTPHLHQLSNLYQIISATSSIDHPLCTDCMEALIALMGKELEDGKRERDRLIAFERDVVRKREEAGSAGVAGGREALMKEIAKYERAERAATEELKEMELERLALEKEKKELDFEEANLMEEEERFWRNHSSHLLEAAAIRDRVNSLQTKYSHEVLELEKLNKANVYTDAFCIGHDGSFGTINKLRLGRLSNIQVEWPEINAAWGHTLLLLHTIARKFRFTFETYRLIPMGSFSRIEKIEGGAIYELYGSGDFNGITRMLQNRRFDQAMIAFLDCLRQMMDFVKTKDKNLKFPHAVVKDKIGDVSIKYQFTVSSSMGGVYETWTRALRHVLFDLRILLGRATL